MGEVIALLAGTLAIAPTASALSYTFSFSNVNGLVPGTVQGTVVLPDGDGTGIAATSVSLTSAPAALGYTLPFNPTTNFNVNSFTVASGNIVLVGSSLFIAQGSNLTLNLTTNNVGSVLTALGNTIAINGQNSGVQDATNSTLTFLPATPVPFEFNPVIGVGLLGAGWLGSRIIKKAKSKNI